jgi:hypothetical protein
MNKKVTFSNEIKDPIVRQKCNVCKYRNICGKREMFDCHECKKVMCIHCYIPVKTKLLCVNCV